jgi:23S rRNA pseudouridine1911/1915/1917 synthase
MANQTITVSRAEAGQPVATVLRRRLSVSWSYACRLLRERRVRLGRTICLDPNQRVVKGQRLEVQDEAMSGSPEARSGTISIPIPFLDEHIVVVEKPAGLTTMRHPEEAAEFGARARRFLPPTLADLLPEVLGEGPRGRSSRIRPVHRLDNETSGLVVFARTVKAERQLGGQFRAHSIERSYLALVRGRAVTQTIESCLVRDRGDGRRGSTLEPRTGQRAVTNVRVVEELANFTLVECRLGTGRTHQVRIHLGEAGTPLCGERVYDRPLHGKPLPDESGAKRIMLHAARLGIDHPATGKRLVWTAPLPKDMATLLAKLRKGLRC